MPREQSGFPLTLSSLLMKPRSQPVSGEYVTEFLQLPHLLLLHAFFYWADTLFLSFYLSEPQSCALFFLPCLLLSSPLHWACARGLSAAADVCDYRQLHSLDIPYYPHSALSHLSISSSLFPFSSLSLSLSNSQPPSLWQGTNQASSVVSSPSHSFCFILCFLPIQVNTWYSLWIKLDKKNMSWRKAVYL